MSALAAIEIDDFAACAQIATEGRAAARASTSPWMQGPALACLAYKAMHEGTSTAPAGYTKRRWS
jgi:hypothetical protein